VIDDLATIRSAIISCQRCARLRDYCQLIAREKRAAFRHETYWGRPVPGFGDPNARILLVALAPAAHGANRTGRAFTGDGAGGSSDFLMTALHANGLANQPFSRGIDDGLELTDAWIAAAVRCAPPDNRPLPAEIVACHPHLVAEVAALPRLRVIVALGRIAFDATWRLLADRCAGLGTIGGQPQAKPAFGHGLTYHLPGAPAVVASYHPSRQNTNTRKLTPPMLEAIFRNAKALCEASAGNQLALKPHTSG
jgi:uracil-DNA glycosylase family 4